MLHESDRMGGFVHLPRNTFNTFFLCPKYLFNLAFQLCLLWRLSLCMIATRSRRFFVHEAGKTFLHHQRPSRCSTFSYKWTLEFLPASVVKCQAKTRAAQCIIFSRVFVPTRDKRQNICFHFCWLVFCWVKTFCDRKNYDRSLFWFLTSTQDLCAVAKVLRDGVNELNLPGSRGCRPCSLHSAVIVQMTAVWQANSAMSGLRLTRSGPSANGERISGN